MKQSNHELRAVWLLLEQYQWDNALAKARELMGLCPDKVPHNEFSAAMADNQARFGVQLQGLENRVAQLEKEMPPNFRARLTSLENWRTKVQDG